MSAAPQLHMFPKSTIDLQILNIEPGPGRDLAVKRYRAIQPILNHDFKALNCRSHSGLVRAVAATQEVAPNTVRRWVEKFLEGGGKIEVLADKPPGPPPGTGTVLDASMQAHVIDCWQIQKLTKMQTYRSLNNYLREKQRGVGTSWSYVVDGTGEDFVSRTTVERFIDERLGGELNPWRAGGTAIKDAAGYIDRVYDEHSGDAWCIDEWECDGIFYEPAKHSALVQNPHAYLLTIIDERTTRILVQCLVRSLSPDAVADVLEEAVRNFGKPKFLVRDKGGHFRTKIGGRMVVRKHGELIETAAGYLGKLGVTVRTSKAEKNPRGNRIERATHGLYKDLARRDFGPSWCGTRRINKDGINLRELSGIDERISKHLREHCQLGTCGPQLLSTDDAACITAGWVEEINMAPTLAKGCSGMTRLAAYNQFRPLAAELEARKVSDAELLAAFSEDFDGDNAVTIQKGGIIAIGDGPIKARYSSSLLVLKEKQKVRVTRARHDHSFVLVYLDGEVIRAERRETVGLNDPEATARANAQLARTRRALENAARPVIDLTNWEEAGILDSEVRSHEPEVSMKHPSEKFALSATEPVVPERDEVQGVGFADLE